MNDHETQQLIFRASQWPWRWFKLVRESAALAERERCKFSILKEEYHLLKLEASELHKRRTEDAERMQELRSEIQVIKLESTNLNKDRLASVEREKLLAIEVQSLRDERSASMTKHDQMKEGVKTLFEFIRRNKVMDDRGRDIPAMRPFTNILRQ